MSTDYPVRIDVVSPLRFERIQLLLRIGIAIMLGWLGLTAGWLVGVLFVVLPLTAAVAISALGGDGYLQRLAPQLWRVLDWLLRFSAYMLLVIDRFPTERDASVAIELRCTGHPTIGSALARLIASVPSGVVMVLLWVASSILWFFAALIVLLGLSMPRSIIGFQRGLLRWQARLVAYHASFVAEYPPWSFDTDLPSNDAFAAAGGR